MSTKESILASEAKPNARASEPGDIGERVRARIVAQLNEKRMGTLNELARLKSSAARPAEIARRRVRLGARLAKIDQQLRNLFQFVLPL